MSIIKIKCSCNKLYLSETLSGYDTICDYDGKICNNIKADDNSKTDNIYQVIDDKECKKRKLNKD